MNIDINILLIIETSGISSNLMGNQSSTPQSSIPQLPYTIPNVFEPEKIKSYPVFSQIKYEGIRFYARLVDNRVMVRSYLGNKLDYYAPSYILPILEYLRDHYPPDHDIILLGTWSKPSRSDKLTIWIYDASLPGSLSYRWNILSQYIHSDKRVKLVDYSVHDSIESIQNEYKRVIEEGHEGLLIRDPIASYIGGCTDTVLEY